MADALIEFETLNADQIDDIMAGAKPRAPSDGSGPANRAKGRTPIVQRRWRATSVVPPKNTDAIVQARRRWIVRACSILGVATGNCRSRHRA